MTFQKTKYLMRALSMILILTVTASLITPVHATDKVDSLKQSTSDLENELSGLNSELEQLSDDISSISKQMKEMTTRIEEVKEALAIAKGEEAAQYETMKTRIQYMYESGGSNLLHMLLSANSMADFLKRAEFFSTISEYDRNALKKLEKTRETIALQEAQLEEEQKTLVALQQELNTKEEALKNEISATSTELSSYKKQLAKAQEDAKNAEDALNQQVIPVTPPKEDSSSGSSDWKPDLGYSDSASDIELFAALIECEAGNTNYEGMLAVASVVVNRMKDSRYPNTLRGVIKQSGQFPPAHNGLVDKKLARGVKPSCLQVAQDALAGKNNVGGCLSFRAASSGHEGIFIGGNVFF